VDRRQRRVVATSGSAAVLADLEHRVAVAEDAVLGALDPDDRTTVGTLLRRAACEYRDAEAGDPCTVVERALGR
jgi:MarR family transcriptional regulator for hemolysin